MSWRIGKENKMLYVASLFAALAAVTKSNGFVLMGIIFILLLFDFVKSEAKRQYFKKIFLVMIIFILGIAINVYDNLYYALKENRKDWLVASLVNVNANVNKGLYVGNKPENYLFFDINTFLTVPYTSTWEDWGGRQFFWNFLLKSSLFGEFNFPNLFLEIIALILSFILLSMTLFFLAGCFFYMKTKLRKKRRYGLILLSVVLLLALLIVWRIKSPLSALADFRYIYPIVVSFSVFYSFSLEVLKDKNWRLLAALGYIQALVFCILSSVFFIVNSVIS